jgi:hypothetical protein
VLAGLVVVALLAWVTGGWLADGEWSPGPGERWPVAVLAPLLAALLVSTGLAGADEELERTAPVRWRVIRIVHVIVAASVAGVALALTGLWEPRIFGSFELVRNAAACLGLIALSAIVLGARLAWAPATGYVLAVVAVGPRDPDTAWWTWPIQPWGAHRATWSALLLLLAGAVAYAWLGARPDRHTS